MTAAMGIIIPNTFILRSSLHRQIFFFNFKNLFSLLPTNKEKSTYRGIKVTMNALGTILQPSYSESRRDGKRTNPNRTTSTQTEPNRTN